MFARYTLFPIALVSSTFAAGCVDADTESDAYDFSSAEATLVVMEFDGELIADSLWSAESKIEDQMLYTIGHLNGNRSVGRLDKLELSQIEREDLPSGQTRITYHAKLPVGWGSKTNIPQSYELTLPLHVDADDYQRFTDKYKEDCVDWSAHDVDSSSMWYYYRPKASGCSLAAEDVFRATASVTVSSENTTGRYPEYHKVWEDNALSVVAIFGKYEDGATTSSDAGISAYNNFTRSIKQKLGSSVVTTPANVPSSPGVAMPDITFRAPRADGRTVEVIALLVDNVRTAGFKFDQRYAAISGDADLVFYNGHAGLGANIRALARKGSFKAGKYQMFFMNGCDTFAYVDAALAEARASLNPDDASGTRYLDMVTNVMPSFFSSMPRASMALIEGLLSVDAPMTYDLIFKNIDRAEVVVVTGEEDNVYYPGFEPGGGEGWEGFEESGAVAQDEKSSFSLGELPAGQYTVTTSGTGDVDLYVAVGRAPTLDDYDHRPYLWGSDESVTLTLDAPAQVFVMLHGYEAGSFTLEAKAITE